MASNRGKRRPVLAVTVGDPAGIGPEIVESLFRSFTPRRSTALIVGAATVFERLLGAIKDRATVVDEGAVADDRAGAGRRILFLDTGCRARFSMASDSRGGGSHAGLALEAACGLAKSRAVAGIVTAPISKKALDLAGYRFTGHTEMLARYFGAPECQMMMVHGRLRIVPLTRHIPVSRVARSLTPERILTCLDVVNTALVRQFGVEAPRIAVAGLNPHAGEGGVLGREEIETIQPAIQRARRRHIDVTGPMPADAMFQQATDGTFDAFVAMYHDQGLIPFKLVAQRRGVNVTVGLPIVRTSVDHGVAYDVAGTGVASTSSLKRAYQLAESLVARGRMGSTQARS